MDQRTTTACVPRASCLRRDDAGVTLMEVVIAMVLLGIMASAVLGLVLTAQATTVDSRNRVAAANLAAREIEFVREQFMASDSGPLTIAGQGVVTNANPLDATGTAGDPLVIDGTPYTVVRSSAWNITGTGESACEGGSLVSHPTLIVTASVTWPNMRSTQPVVNTAALAPERGLGLPTTASFIAVAVKDSQGAPSPGRAVTVFSSGSGAETRTGLTDASGCAVISVNPPPSGNDYTARFTDAGYVDITGTSMPERSVGRVEQGQLAANVEVALDRAASVTLRLTGSITAGEANGTTISLYQSEASGSAISPHVLTGLETVIGNLWPTQYSAFFGSDIPAILPSSVTLEPGGTGLLEVPFIYADFTVENLPVVPGLPATSVVAVTPGGTCTTPGARTINPGNGQLPAGVWSFFLQSPAIGCSPGIENVSLLAGPNAPVDWASTTLRLLGAPIGQGAIWAAPAASGAECTATNAIKLADDGGTVGPVTLTGGDWYVFAMADGGGQPSGAVCRSTGLVNVPYGQDRSFTWASPGATLRVVNGTADSRYRYMASAAPVITCTNSTVSNGGAPYFTLVPAGSVHSTPSLGQGTWYVYEWRVSGGFGNRCSGGSPVTIGWDPGYTLNWSNGAVSVP